MPCPSSSASSWASSAPAAAPGRNFAGRAYRGGHAVSYDAMMLLLTVVVLSAMTITHQQACTQHRQLISAEVPAKCDSYIFVCAGAQRLTPDPGS